MSHYIYKKGVILPYETKQTIFFMETKLFKEMTSDEQLRYVSDLTCLGTVTP